MTPRQFADEYSVPAITGAVALILAGVLAYFLMHMAGHPPEHHEPPPITMVTIKPPPPPPPPPPQQKTIVPPKTTIPTPKPVTPVSPPKPVAAAPAPAHMGTSIKGNGPDSFNLSGSGCAAGEICGMGNGTGGEGTCTGDYCSYSAVITGEIQNALQKNPITRNAAARMTLRIWIDSRGTVTRVTVNQSSGDPKVDDAVQNQVLPGLRLSDPPPADTPMPVLVRMTGEQGM